MNNNNIVPQPAEKQGYQTLGTKVFWLFFLQLSPAAFILIIISIIIFALSFQPFLINNLPDYIQQYSLSAALIISIISLFFLALSFAVAWLTYTNYVFLMTENYFKIKRGIFSKTENAIPYRQIQNIDIERSFIFQLLGLSRLVILTAGHEDEKPKGASIGFDESEGIIPAIDQKLAEMLQTELLKRADVQRVIETK